MLTGVDCMDAEKEHIKFAPILLGSPPLDMTAAAFISNHSPHQRS